MRANKTNTVTLAAAVFAITTLSLDSAIAADAKSSLSVEIGPQSLEAALVELSKQGHLQLVIATGSLPTKMSEPLHGSMPLGVALDRLLKDTGLTYKLVGDHTIAIVNRQLSDPSALPGVTGITSPNVDDGNAGKDIGKKNAIKGDQSVNHRSLALRLATIFGICVSTAVQGPVCAQDAPASEPEGGGLEEIVVTAQRRSEDIQKVPISVQAFSQQTLDKLDIQSTDQLQFATPGFVNTETSGDGISAIYIRGVGTGYSGPGLEGSVAMYVDDVYLQTQTSSAQEAIDLSQVEVLKGPQGTLYGRNATGGAVVVTTNDPQLNSDSGYVKVGYGSLNWTREEAVVNTPLSSTVANRFVEFYQYRDGYVDNIAFPNQQKSGVGAGDTYEARDKLLWEPADNFKVVAWGQYDRRAGNGAIHSLRYYADGMPTGLGYYQTMQALNREGGGGDDTDGLEFAVRAEYSLNIWKFSDTLAYRRTRAFGCTDNDGLPAGELYFCTVSQRSPDPGTAQGKVGSAYTDEFRIVSNSGGPFDLVAGAFFERSQARFVGRIEGTDFGTAMPTFDNHDDLNAYSGFFDVNYKVLERLKLTAGVRYTDENKYHSVLDDPDAIALLGGVGPALTASPFGSQTASFTNFSPRFVVSYDADSIDYYASFNRGFKSGGFNSPDLTLDPILKPETITAYEVGAKYRSPDGALRLSGALFDYDWKNQQVAFITGGGAGIEQQNAAASRIYGGEFNLDYALTQTWLFNAGFGYTHARYINFPDAAVYNLINGALTTTSANLNGYRLPEAPDYTANLNITYRFSLPERWTGNVVAGARYTSQYDFTPDGGGSLHASQQPNYTLVNLTGTVIGPNEHLLLRAFITNLTGVHYVSLISTGTGGVYETPNEPRLVGIYAQYSF